MQQPYPFVCPQCGCSCEIVIHYDHTRIAKDSLDSARILLAIDGLRAMVQEWPNEENKRRANLLVQTALDCLLEAVDNLEGN